MKISTAAIVSAFVFLAACAHKRTPSDEQLIALLHSDQSSMAAKIESSTANCLRAWSGDDKLIAGLPANLAAEAPGRVGCKARISDWIGNTQRNPERFTFEEVSAPPVVKRIVVLSSASLANMSGDDKIPAALQKPIVTPAIPAPDASPVDLGAAGQDLAQAESLCAQVQQKAAEAAENAPIKRFASDCSSSLKQIRTTMEQAARSNPSQERLSAIAVGATNFTATAQRLLFANH